jgi:hypothetical protein
MDAGPWEVDVRVVEPAELGDAPTCQAQGCEDCAADSKAGYCGSRFTQEIASSNPAGGTFGWPLVAGFLGGRSIVAVTLSAVDGSVLEAIDGSNIESLRSLRVRLALRHESDQPSQHQS